MNNRRCLDIAIDARVLSGPDVFTGYTTYLTSIAEALLNNGHKITLLSDKPLLPEHTFHAHCSVEIIGKPAGRIGRKFNIGWWENTAVKTYLGKSHHDIYFAPSNSGIPLVKTRGTRYIAGILDIIPFKFPREYMLQYHFHFIRLQLIPFLVSVYRSDEIITISDHAVSEISQYFHKKNVTMVPFKALDPLGKEIKLKRKEFVYVGGQNPRKRVDKLLRAFALFKSSHPDYKLVLIGRAYETYEGLIAELNLIHDVEITGYIPEEQKFERIRHSAAMVYPSTYEGYGLAIAEGLQVGAPVIAGKGGSQAEVGGRAVIYIDPTNEKDIAHAMEDVLDEVVQNRLRVERKKVVSERNRDIVNDKIDSYFSNKPKEKRST